MTFGLLSRGNDDHPIEPGVYGIVPLRTVMLGGVVVADDLTGACDTGHGFAARGHRTKVLLDPQADVSAVDVLVVDTDSRYVTPQESIDRVRGAIDAHPASVVFKKIDSTLRGNVSVEVDAALTATIERSTGDRAATGVAVAAPASPAIDRTTACGYHLVDGALVTDTEPGRDVENGPSSAHLPTLFAETERSIEHLHIRTVANGASAITKQLRDREGRGRILTADATHDEHLANIAEAVRRLDVPTVYVGSSGLANHVEVPSTGTDADTAGDVSRPSPPEDSVGVLGVVGSVAPSTLAALQAVPESTLIDLDPVAIVEDPDTTADLAVDRTREVLSREGCAVVTAATDSEADDRAFAAGSEIGVSRHETRDRIAETLAEIAAVVVDIQQPSGVLLTGGDTAGNVLDALNASAIALSGDAVEAGIPLGVIEGGTSEGSVLITKAGAFGDHKTVVNCLDRLQEL